MLHFSSKRKHANVSMLSQTPCDALLAEMLCCTHSTFVIIVYTDLYLSYVEIRHRLWTMGRRKSKRKAPPKKKMTGDLDTQFTCPFCNHEKSCDVKMYLIFFSHFHSIRCSMRELLNTFLYRLLQRERSRNTGIISCSVCLEEFQTPITCILSQG